MADHITMGKMKEPKFFINEHGLVIVEPYAFPGQQLRSESVEAHLLLAILEELRKLPRPG